ncbi:MAG: hypothetical protein LBD50_00625 [Rickettsiales bacterium]|jgi:hypothetical protein|nr:hypothetical protein [Rickettsiales bacterium]
MTAEEAWGFIERKHRSYHSRLKHLGYEYDMFIPNHLAMYEMYDIEELTSEQIEKYRNIFMNEIYNVKNLQELDHILQTDSVPALQSVVDTLAPMAKKWGLQLPNILEIQTTYGSGGSYYWNEKSLIILRMFRKHVYNSKAVVGLLQHEFIHLLIEQSIIQKYNVPQDLKERIVDIIGFEYFGKPVRPMFENSFANNYITKHAIENDLPGAVKKMMMDYGIFKAKMHEGKLKG